MSQDTWTVGTNDWVPTTDPHVLRLTNKMLEELNELGKVLARINLQGLDGVDPATGETNAMNLEKELADVLANADLMLEFLVKDEARVAVRRREKRQRLRIWLLSTKGT